MKEYYIIGQDFDDGMKWYFIKDYTNEEQPVSHYDYTEDKDEAQVFESYEDALDTLMSVHNFQDVCISDGGDDFAPVEDWKIAYYDETGALYDGRTDKYIVDYDGAEMEESYNIGKSMKFNEATTILKRAGYKVLNETVDIVDEVRDLLKHYGYEDDTIENEIMDYSFIDELAQQGYDAYDIADELLDAVYGNVNLDVDEDETKMNEALEGPATSKQLWTLFKLTHKDYRGQDLSKQAASDMIGELLGKKKNGDTTSKPRKAPASDENSPVKVGEIYHRSWGYSMTINTYFKVLSVKGKSAMVIELQKDVVKGCMQQGYVVANNSPEKGAVPQKALIKDDGTIKVKHYSDKYETYRKWDGKPDYEDHMD